MQISYKILVAPQQRGNTYTVNIDGYRFLEELWEELASLGIIDRLKDVPQLGNIPVRSKLKKSRYDYVMLQMYLHQFVRKNLNSRLKYSYSNSLKKEDLLSDENIIMTKDESTFYPSVGDAMQVFALVYNIGHFYNTFTSSMAAMNLVCTVSKAREKMMSLFTEGIDCIVDDILSSENYHRFHLINSLMILEKCDQTKPSVKLAKKLISLYINRDLCNEKMAYVFDVFKDIRTFSYFIYDLPVSRTPLYLDIRDSESLETMLAELLDQYNNKMTLKALLQSVDKILDDTVYNENVRGIVSYQISKDMEKVLRIINWESEDYYQLFFDKDSVFNRAYPQNRQFDKQNILKITFYPSDDIDWQALLNRLNKKDNVKVGCYDRVQSGGKTLLVSIKSTCADATKKTRTAYKIMKEFLSAMNQSKSISAADSRFIILAKYFLYYLLGEYPLRIIPTVDETKCVLVKRGRTARITEINKLLNLGNGSDDSRHEVEFLRTVLEAEKTNDVCVMICGSIITYRKDFSGNKINEYDGILIFPNRIKNQIIFLEAKNTKESAQARTCLKRKLKNTPIGYKLEDIKKVGNDCKLAVSI